MISIFHLSFILLKMWPMVAYKTIYFLILLLKTEMKKPANKYIEKENKTTQQKKKDKQNKAKCQITMQFLKLV